MVGVVNELLQNVPLPRMVPVRQSFEDAHIEDISQRMRQVLDRQRIALFVRPGMKIAVTAGSRGIANIALLLRELVGALKDIGAEPFVIPAMGSHGGATSQGQLQVLYSLGITEDYLGCPIKSSMNVQKIGVTKEGRPVQIDAFAAQADGTILLNRIKPHTSFTGRYESGLMKMMAIGLAKQTGAEACHQEGYGKIADNIEKYGRAILEQGNILFGIGVLENALDKTCKIEFVPKEQIAVTEPPLLQEAKALMPRILFPSLDVLVVNRMGKNISGLGMDPHITGCFATPYVTGPARPDKVVVLDLTDETHGNANGVGVADIATRRLLGKFNFENTYPNAVTSTLTQAVRIPMILDNQRLAIQGAIKMASGFNKGEIRIVQLEDTLHLKDIYISEALLSEAMENPSIEILGKPVELSFDKDGNLF